MQRSLNASYREYAMLRKLDRRPKSPLTQIARIIGPSQAPSPLEHMSEESVDLQPTDYIEQSAMPVDNQSQVPTAPMAPKIGLGGDQLIKEAPIQELQTQFHPPPIVQRKHVHSCPPDGGKTMDDWPVPSEMVMPMLTARMEK